MGPGVGSEVVFTGETRSVCAGIFEFPRLDLWTVHFMVCRREKEKGEKERGKVVVRLGQTLACVMVVGAYDGGEEGEGEVVEYHVGMGKGNLCWGGRRRA